MVIRHQPRASKTTKEALCPKRFLPTSTNMSITATSDMNADFAPIKWLYTVVFNIAIDNGRRPRKVDMPRDPETGVSLEDQIISERPDETPQGIENKVIAPGIARNLGKFWSAFYGECNPTERKIADLVAADGPFFEHDGTLVQIVQSTHAVLFERSCHAMGITKPRSVLAARIREVLGLSVNSFDVRRHDMRKHWRAARSVYDSPLQKPKRRGSLKNSPNAPGPSSESRSECTVLTSTCL
jgi:hypothetical protein